MRTPSAPAAGDAALAVLLAAAVQAELWWYDGGPDGVAAVTAAASLLFTALLAWRSRRPDAVLVAAAVVVVVQATLGGRMTSTLSLALTTMVMVFSAGLLLRRARALLGAAVLLAATWFDLVLVDHDDFGVLSDLVFTTVLMVGAPLLAGITLREHRLRADELHRLNRELMVERGETARLAARDERHRIAREVHDVVAHSLSLMVVQVGAARHLLDRDPPQSRRALAAAEGVGREALLELRRTLGVLRESLGEPADLAPRAGLAGLPALVDSAREGGLDVDLLVDDPAPVLTLGAEVAAYRIVQESLTNVLKHAPGARVVVRVTGTSHEARLLVENDPPAVAPLPRAGGGHGLRGMRERAEIHGGACRVGARPDGGFRVEARLPTAAETVSP